MIDNFDAKSSRFKLGILRLLLALSLIWTLWPPHAASTETVLVPVRSFWRYLDNGTDQGTVWRDLTFNDNAWSAGPAQLGYGDGDETTKVGYGPNSKNKFVTTYFRHSFLVADASAYRGLTLRVLRDDGAVVYLNGAEIFRSNMPAGVINYRTLASSSVGGAAETTLFYSTAVDARLLVNGTNVLAVEIHQSSVTSSDISFDLELLGSETVSLTRGPYLQMGTPTGIVVKWRTNGASDSRVRYGTDTASLTAFSDDATLTTEHEVTLSNLLPDTKYYYSVGTTTNTPAGGDLSYSFVTSPATGTSKPTRIWVIGDSGTANVSAAAVRDAYLSFTASRHTDLWLMLGDNAYDDGTDTQYQAAVFDMYPTILRQSALWPTMGNHDGHTANSGTQTGPYYDIFSLPKQGEAGGLASGTEAYYSFDYGNIHFICLDSFGTDRSPTGPMMTWMQMDLAATAQQWIIAFWHHPPYSKGSHDSDSDSGMTQMRTNALPILEAGGVDLVLTGHSHSYERSFLLDGHYGVSSTLAQSYDKGCWRWT